MSKTIELCKVRQGEFFTIDGVEFVKLDEKMGGAFVVTTDTLPDTGPFEHEDAERNDHNNFVGSCLMADILEWANNHPSIKDAMLERPIDLTSMDGMTDYGIPCVKARTLTIDEFRKYRCYIPLTSKPWWTATPWCTDNSPYSDACSAYLIYTDGSVNYNGVYYANFASRPAFYLKSSILVSINDGAPDKGIRDFSDTDLIDELYRRRRESYDPD